MNTKYLILAIVLVGLVLLLTACNLNVKRGSGNLISETRNVSNFDRVRLSGSGELIIIQDGEESLIVETDDNLMENIKTEVRGDTLELGFDPARAIHISPTQLTFTLHVDDLRSLDIAGSGTVEAESIEAERLDIDVSGSGNIQIDSLIVNELDSNISGSGKVNISGETANQEVDIDGSGIYQTENLLCETVTVDISGSGEAVVWVTDSLDAHISGSGSLSYYGDPTVTSSTPGSGTIRGMGEK